jgi:hypothetical protein
MPYFARAVTDGLDRSSDFEHSSARLPSSKWNQWQLGACRGFQAHNSLRRRVRGGFSPPSLGNFYRQFAKVVCNCGTTTIHQDEVSLTTFQILAFVSFLRCDCVDQ